VYHLQDLVQQITPQNLHGKSDTEIPIGLEMAMKKSEHVPDRNQNTNSRALVYACPFTGQLQSSQLVDALLPNDQP
jgi:hypothetical protein